jgi:hypothetical protein
LLSHISSKHNVSFSSVTTSLMKYTDYFFTNAFKTHTPQEKP